MKKFPITFALIMLASLCVSQTASWQKEKNEFIEAYQKAWQLLIKTESYSFQLKYLSFQDHHSKHPFENASGYYKKTGNNYISHVMGIKTIQNNRVKIIIDSAEKLILLNSPQSFSPVGIDEKELSSLLNNVKRISKKQSDNKTIYRIEFENNKLYESYELTLNEKNFPQQLTYYYSEQIDRDYNEKLEMVEKKIKPRLEIHFNGYKLSGNINEADLSETLYVTAINNKLKTTEKFRNYELKDYRFNNKR